MANQGNMEGISLVRLAVPSVAVMMLLIVLYYWKYGSFRHVSFPMLVASHLPYLFVERIGDDPTFRNVVSVIFK
jgi:hypothetical protein